MDYAGERTTIETRLGRAGGLSAPLSPRLCQPGAPIFIFPILSRSAALLTLLLQDGTVDLELTSSVVGLDPGVAFGTLQAANLERNGDGEIWQFPLAVVAGGCDRLQTMVNCAPRVESSYAFGAGANFRQLYLRCVQQACIAEFLASLLDNINPKHAYVVGLLSSLPGMDGPISPTAGGDPIAACVLLADELLEISTGEIPEASPQLERLAASPLWECWDGGSTRERCRILAQGSRLGKWVAANAQRLSPWEFMARLHRRRSWD